MEFQFLYGNKYRSFIIPDTNVLYHALLGSLQPTKSEEEEVERALSSPIGLPALRQMVGASSRVVIVVDDLTRATPQKRLLPVLLDHLNSLGVADANIKIIIALGTHRFMTPEEILQRFGETVISRVPVLNHDFLDHRNHIYLGTTSLGTPVEINREVCEADLRITLGMVVPHPLAGWGGGAKMIQPGVCSERTTEATHFIGGTYRDPLALPGNPDNPVRHEIEEVVERVGLLFTINTVINHEGRLVRCFAGHPVKAHREAVKLAEELFRPRIPDLADIVICNAYPCDRDFWQGFKPFYYSQFGVREGGTMILVISAPEGLSGDAPMHASTMKEWSTKEPDEILGALNRGEIKDRIAGSVCVAHSRLLKRAKVICVSDGMTEEDILALGFEPANSIEEGLERAFKQHGRSARVGIIPYAGETLVRVE